MVNTILAESRDRKKSETQYLFPNSFHSRTGSPEWAVSDFRVDPDLFLASTERPREAEGSKNGK
jgi:hypothetical protein